MWRTTYLVRTIGESVFTRIRRSICELCMIASAPSGAQRGVVDEPVDRPEILPQLLDEVRDLLDVSEIERHEMERPRTRLLGVFDRRGELIVHLPRDGDGAVALADRAGRTIPRPRPRLPPVTITLRMTGQLAGGGDLERGNETDRRRNLVGARRS